MIEIVVLGDGLLGSEIVRQTGWDYISRKKDGIDFTDINSYKDLLEPYDIIVNCIANTDTYSQDKKSIMSVNYDGLVQLVDYCKESTKKLVHISTDYVYSNSESLASENDVPVHCKTWYGYSKLVGDAYIELKLGNFTIFRCSFKPNPFPYKKAFVNQIGNFDYVDVIAKYIIKGVENDVNGIVNIGTGVKTMYELAKQTNKFVEPIKIANPLMPLDISMNLNRISWCE